MLSLTPADARNLSARATAALDKALLSGGPRSAAPWDEVSAVKAVVFDGFEEIARTWTPILMAAGYGLHVTSVFTHCRPHVDFSAGRCELADLLVVMDDDSAAGRTDRRAVLIQAKILKAGATTIKLASKELKQFKLLSGWPAFTFTEAIYHSRPRDFLAASCPGDPHLSGEYGAIDLHAAPRTWDQCLTGAPGAFTGNHPLGDFLVRMASGANMYGREAVAGETDDWSFTIDELLSVTAALPVTKASGTPRGNAQTLGMMTADKPFGAGGGYGTAEGRSGGWGGGPPEGRGEDPTEGWGEGPLSVVRMRFAPFDEAPR